MLKPCLGVVLLVALLQPALAPRQVAITIDDGPVVGELKTWPTSSGCPPGWWELS